MIRARGISEKIVYAYNPLPNVKDQELLDMAGLSELFTAATRSPFAFTWKYSSGLTGETIELLPGDFIPLRSSEAREFLQSTNAQELGMCVVETATLDDKRTRELAIAALQKALTFYHEGGTKQLINQRKRHSYSEAEMAEQRGFYHPYYLNQAKEQVVRARIAELKAPRKAAAVAKAG